LDKEWCGGGWAVGPGKELFWISLPRSVEGPYKELILEWSDS